MKYALLIYGNGAREAYDRLGEDERRSITAEYMAIRQLPATVGGEQLAPDAKTVVDGSVTDGPYTETKDVLGGFYLVDAADDEAALEIARQIPVLRLGGAVEIRPLVEVQR
jgi:hypothetical protein